MSNVHAHGPTSRDLARLVIARASSHLSVSRADARYADTTIAAFRDEIGATVRSMSPLIPILFEAVGTDLEEFAWAIAPAAGWPDKPKLPVTKRLNDGRSSTAPGDITFTISQSRRMSVSFAGCHGVDVVSPVGERFAIRVVDHSIEVVGQVDGFSFATASGYVRIGVTVDPRGPILSSLPGRYLGEIGDLPFFALARWRIASVDDLGGGRLGVVARTGSRTYRLPWAR